MMTRRFYCMILMATAAIAFAGCSTQKNTAASRIYHSVLTRYNVYFNGKQAFEEGCEEQEKAKQDNYLETLDLFPISDPKTKDSGKSHFDKAIEKAKKCVTLHSIKKKPVAKEGHTKTEKEKQFLAKNEYNPFLWHAWILMGDAQMQEGEFLEAASTYSYTSRLYADEPHIVAMAEMRMAQCYSELGWLYEAEELFSRISQDSIPSTLKKEYAAIRTSYLLKQGRNEEASATLKTTFPQQGISKLQKIRRYYLLGQLYKQQGDNDNAYECFGKVIRMNPPYLIEFNARIQQTETMASSGNTAAMEKKLEKMARNPNNKNYLDQVYYAMGNLHLVNQDTLKALETYETGLEKGTSRRPERGILLLRMASLYWEREDYFNAQRCYSEAVGLIDPSDPSYEEVKLRSKSLEELVKYTNEIKLQDSLQYLATLPEETLLKVIDKAIEELKEADREKAEKEEADAKAAEKEEAETREKSIQTNDGSWYFYNPALVKEGEGQFARIWGRRRLEDNWRRSEKNASMTSFETVSTDTEYQDSTSLAMDAAGADTLVMRSTDPYSREYYLQDIPYTEEQINLSNSILSEALFRAGLVYKDELTQYPLAEGNLTRSADDYPEQEYADDALYNLYLMYSLWNRPEDAEKSRSRLLEEYPDSKFAQTLADPAFRENALYGKHREDSLYQAAYAYYLAGDNQNLADCCRQSEEKYPGGQLRAKFLFLEASTLLKDNKINEYLGLLKQIIEKYPQEEISNLAGVISEGVRSGRILQASSLGSIWDLRRNDVLEDSTGTKRAEFSAERNQPYIVILAYPDGALNENQLLFETARYNFSRYMIRNFDISFRREEGIGMLVISEFLNFDEAHLYCRRLFEESDMSRKLDGINTLIITPQNLEILLRQYSFNEYQEFYDRTFTDIPEFDIDGLTLDGDIVSLEELIEDE